MTPDWGRGGTVSGSQKGRTDLPQSSKGRAKDGFDLHTVPDPGRQLGLDGRGGVPLVQEHYAGKVLLVPDGPAWTEWGRVFLLCPSCSSALRLETAGETAPSCHLSPQPPLPPAAPPQAYLWTG